MQKLKNFYDFRVNIQNRPSVANRTLKIIHEVMNTEGVSMGVAIERLIVSSDLWEHHLNRIAEYDKSIKIV